MTLWEYQACMDGWNAAHAEEKPPLMDDETLAGYGVEGF